MGARFQDTGLPSQNTIDRQLCTALTMPPSSTSRAAVPGTRTTGSLAVGLFVVGPLPMLPESTGGASLSASIVPDSSGWFDCDMSIVVDE